MAEGFADDAMEVELVATVTVWVIGPVVLGP
jgi:hypothetical protein